MDIKLNMVIRIYGVFFSCFFVCTMDAELEKSGWHEDCLITFSEAGYLVFFLVLPLCPL